MTFPFVVAFFIATNMPINFGSIFLMALGTQWYILFNVIAGTMSIPTDLKEAGQIFGLRGRRLVAQARHSRDLSRSGSPAQ